MHKPSKYHSGICLSGVVRFDQFISKKITIYFLFFVFVDWSQLWWRGLVCMAYFLLELYVEGS